MTVRLPPANLVLDRSGKIRNVYYARIPLTHTLENVLDPDYFGELMGNKALTPGDRIECEAEDFSWDIELRVHAQSASTRQLICRVVRDFRSYDIEDLPKGWTYEWMGGAEHYAIFFEGKVMDRGLTSKEACSSRIHAMISADRNAEAARAAVRSAAAKQGAPKAAAKKAEAA